ncbi:hypothetical protein LCGC14_2277750 [marine sediment metagenome]|uniref:RNase H type-1 domain-containing protein n=1 Tax=marine sediment metagenome TaxID=412755 RepID=A0A0F9F7H7_9ZZZZ
MSKPDKGPENQYTRGPLIKRAAGPIFPMHKQEDVELDGKDPEYVHVWVDGGGQGTTSLGVVVVDEGTIIMTFGTFLGTHNQTNNIAELNAIWKSLRLVKHLFRPVKIYSDSTYAINSICKIFHGKKNRELINSIIDYAKQYPVPIEFVKVKGHSGLVYNEIADSIASWFLSEYKDKKKRKKKKIK